MIYKCVNCGGNVIYDPEAKVMTCSSCGSHECQEAIPSQDPLICSNCGSKLDFGEYGSSGKCPSCGTYLLRDDLITYPYGANLVLPFKIDKRKAEKLLQEEFGKKLFMPVTFLSEKTLENLKGYYVPFWLYDYDTTVDYSATGTKIRHWTSGNRRYTETSFYQVYRKLHVDYQGIPVDASIAMEDGVMDLMEPYKYAELIKHDNKYLSGFYSETYNFTPDQIEPRAISKADEATRQWVRKSAVGYDTLTREQTNINNNPKGTTFAMLPLWIYEYRYRGKNYKFYVNGDTGKCVGTPPLSAPRAFGLSSILFAALFLGIFFLKSFLGVL